MLHYHGTPITPQSARREMAGKHICVSYARRDDADWAMTAAQSIMWDNGAFTTFRQGKKFDFAGFQKWVEPRLGHPHWAVIPDVINGEIQDQRELLEKWHLPRDLSAPVWHLALDVDWLLHLADNFPKVCFGSSKQYWQVGSASWERRADQAFDALEKRGLRPWVHMLRGLDMCGTRWPFASADSANVAVNHKARGICPERMARVIDARQSPIKWVSPHKQLNFFEVEKCA